MTRTRSPRPGVQVAGTLRAVWGFSRPHTVIGTVVSIVTLWLLALQDAASGTAVGLLGLALVGGLATNVYIVGINQVTDVAIDRVNKPFLPLASGALTMRQGRIIVAGSLVVALAAGLLGGVWLLTAFALGVAVGSAYSLRPLRLKRFPFWAAASVSFVRGIVVNIFIYLAFSEQLTGRALLPPRIILLAGAVLVLGLVIAWFKDVPDMAGDRRFGVRTLSLRLGPRRVLAIGLAATAVCHVGVALVALWGLPGLHTGVMVVGSAVLLVAALVAAGRVRFGAPETFVRFYLTVWGLFYAEYVVFATAGVLA